MFREEAIGYRRDRLDEDVVLTGSVPLWVITAFLASATCALAAWISFGKYASTQTVAGVIVPDGLVSKVYADRPGRLVWLGVHEGDTVIRGQRIATLQSEQALEEGGSPSGKRLYALEEQKNITVSEFHYEEKRSNLERSRLLKLLVNLKGQMDDIQKQIEIQREAVASTKSSFDALTPLLSRGFVSHSDYEQRRQAWLGSAAQLQSFRQQQGELEQRVTEAESELAKTPIDHADKLAALKSALSDLQQRTIEAEGSRGYAILAPVSGRVTAVQTDVGKSSDGHLPLLSIVPNNVGMAAVVYAPTRAIGLAHVGDPVRLLYDAFPYSKFGSFSGHVRSISHTILSPSEVDAPLKLEEAAYEVRITLDRDISGTSASLRPGMTLTADIVVERRSFLSWILEPLQSLRRHG